MILATERTQQLSGVWYAADLVINRKIFGYFSEDLPTTHQPNTYLVASFIPTPRENRTCFDDRSQKTSPHSVLMLRSRLIQVAKLEELGGAAGGKRQLSRRELEEELENVKRVNRNFYKFAVEELMTEVYQATEKNAT